MSVVNDSMIEVERGSFSQITLKSPELEGVNVQYNDMAVYKDGEEIDNIKAKVLPDNNYLFSLIVDDKYSKGEYGGVIRGIVDGKSISKEILINVVSIVEDKFCKKEKEIDESLPLEMQNWK